MPCAPFGAPIMPSPHMTGIQLDSHSAGMNEPMNEPLKTTSATTELSAPSGTVHSTEHFSLIILPCLLERAQATCAVKFSFMCCCCFHFREVKPTKVGCGSLKRRTICRARLWLLA